jgi:hypothetical protein
MADHVQMCSSGPIQMPCCLGSRSISSSSYLTTFADDGRRYAWKQSRSSVDRSAGNVSRDDVRECC